MFDVFEQTLVTERYLVFFSFHLVGVAWSSHAWREQPMGPATYPTYSDPPIMPAARFAAVRGSSSSSHSVAWSVGVDMRRGPPNSPTGGSCRKQRSTTTTTGGSVLSRHKLSSKGKNKRKMRARPKPVKSLIFVQRVAQNWESSIPEWYTNPAKKPYLVGGLEPFQKNVLVNWFVLSQRGWEQKKPPSGCLKGPWPARKTVAGPERLEQDPGAFVEKQNLPQGCFKAVSFFIGKSLDYLPNWEESISVAFKKKKLEETIMA